MKLGFEESQAAYDSGSQNARVWTESWVAKWLFCPNCGNPSIERLRANRPVADFACAACKEEFELKSQKKAFGKKVLDGAFRTMMERLVALNNPNLFLLNYDLTTLSVTNVIVVPKHFFVGEIIEQRKPLGATARRAGWIGCNILLDAIPRSGKIHLLENGIPRPREEVLSEWQKTLFLREARADARGWLVETMRCVEAIGKAEFRLEEVYAFEDQLRTIYPNNRHIREKLRQQLQVLRDHGYLEFSSRGQYRLRRAR